MTAQVEGYFGDDGEKKSRPGRTLVSVSGYGLNETLTVEYTGRYQVTVPLRQVEQLAADTAGAVARSGRAEEKAVQVNGYYTAGPYKFRQGPTSMWFWTDGRFAMLSLEYGSQGQISIPYQPVLSLIRRSRRNLV